MNTLTFDTHAFVKRLIGAGVPEAQAEAIVTVVSDTREFDLSQLATKTDLFQVKAELKGDISKIESDIRLLKWMLGVIIGGIGSLFAGVASLVAKAFLSH